jgi:hypothetical protein
VSQLSVEQIYQQIGLIVGRFSLLECDRCAKAVLEWLEARGIQGTLLRVRTRYGEDYIISTRLENQGITESITVNGTHYGVEVEGRVFDNLSSYGLPREDWILDFHCLSEQFVLEEVERL